MKLNDNVKMLIKRLADLGFRADVVGGSVRDHLLGREPSDFDLTTNATPDDMKRAFAGLSTVDTGIKHGTVAVILDGEQYEVTTYRKDGEYKDHRHPVGVTFTDELIDDLSRRDFTVNAMAYNPTFGITDAFGGKDDLGAGIIRAVGDPWRRFDEDALRILRAVRFASTLGFKIEEKTAKAARGLAHLLSEVSGERIAVEWRKLLPGEGAYDIISEYGEVLCGFLCLGEVKLPERSAFRLAEPIVRHISLFALSGTNAARRASDRMRLDKKTSVTVSAVLENLDRPMSTLRDQRLLFRDVGIDVGRIAVKTAICLGRADASALLIADEIESENIPYRVRDLALGGKDVMALGICAKRVGVTLDELLSAVIDGRAENNKDALIEYAKAYTGNV